MRVEGADSKLSALILFLGDPVYDRRVMSFATSLVLRGWNVEILSATPGKAIHASSELKGIRSENISLNRKSGPMMFLEYHRRLGKVLDRHSNVDLIIASDLYSLGAAAAFRKKGQACILLYDSREVYTELPSTAGRPLVKFLWWLFEHLNLRSVDAIAVTGPHDLDAIFLKHKSSPRSFLVRNLPEYSEQELTPWLREELHIPTSAPLFLYVGGLQIGRGLAQFLRAFATTAPTGYFVLIGDGALRAELEQLVSELQLKERVRFLGQRPSEEVLGLLAEADVGVSLIERLSMSYQYALPSKLFEYMAAGLVVLVSPLIHVEELFADEEWLVTADPANITDIAAKAEAAVRLASRREVRDRARSLHRERFNFGAEIRYLLDYLDERLSAKNSE